jgi:peptide/nickel transport system ATP-binding protein
MYAGRIVETGPVDQVLDAPRHPYTRGLLESMPARAHPGARLHSIDGMAPSLLLRPAGCAFRPRCPNAIARCAEQSPACLREGERDYCCHAPMTAPAPIA